MGLWNRVLAECSDVCLFYFATYLYRYGNVECRGAETYQHTVGPLILASQPLFAWTVSVCNVKLWTLAEGSFDTVWAINAFESVPRLSHAACLTVREMYAVSPYQGNVFLDERASIVHY